MSDLSTVVEFKLYPRGFLGAPQPPRIEKSPQPFEQQIRSVQNTFSLLAPSSGSNLSANDAVEKLYAQYMTNGASTLGFDFRKKVLIIALKAFGTQYFDLWFEKQIKSPAFGANHADFLDDTLRFISQGYRNVTLETWNSLLSHTEIGELKTEISEFGAEFFGISTGGYHRQRRNGGLTEIIQQWMSQPNGIEDMLCTLHILFGTN